MSTAILSERFNHARLPGWMRLGQEVSNMTAAEAFASLGQYDTQLLPMFAEIDGQRFATGHRMIMRHPTPTSPEYKPFGVVGPGYNIVSPYDLVTTLDTALGEQHPAVIGAPKDGQLFFVGYDMGGAVVGEPKKGDDIRNMMFVFSPYDGPGSIKIKLISLRLVCTNGMIAAKTTQSYVLRHGVDVVKQLERWLTGLWPKAIERNAELLASYNLMTQRRLTEAQALRFTEQLLPIPNHPKATPVAAVNDTRLQDWEYRAARVEEDRAGIMRLARGEGWGIDTAAAAGTAWGWWNSVVEYYDHGKDGRNVNGLVADALFGKAAEKKEEAYALALR